MDWNVLKSYIYYASFDNVRREIERGDVSKNVNEINQDGLTVLHLVSSRGWVDVPPCDPVLFYNLIHWIVDQGADVNATTIVVPSTTPSLPNVWQSRGVRGGYDDSGRVEFTPLGMAIEAQSVVATRDCNADVNRRALRGWTPLGRALELYGRWRRTTCVDHEFLDGRAFSCDIIKLLLYFGADLQSSRVQVEDWIVEDWIVDYASSIARLAKLRRSNARRAALALRAIQSKGKSPANRYIPKEVMAMISNYVDSSHADKAWQFNPPANPSEVALAFGGANRERGALSGFVESLDADNNANHGRWKWRRKRG